VGTTDVRYVSAIRENPSHIGMSRGKSNAFPINGRALGPGGYGSFDLLREHRDVRYLASAIRETAAPTGMAKWESISVLFGMTRVFRGGKQRIDSAASKFIGSICGGTIWTYHNVTHLRDLGMNVCSSCNVSHEESTPMCASVICNDFGGVSCIYCAYATTPTTKHPVNLVLAGVMTDHRRSGRARTVVGRTRLEAID